MPPHLADQIRRQAESAYPEEGAGLLLGTIAGAGRRSLERVLPLENHWEADGRRRRYRLEARDLLAAEDLAEQAGLEILGVFHSHPDHPAAPSAFDLEAALPYYTYLITRVDAGAAGDSQAWRLADDRTRFDEEPIHWLPNA
jgi:proteasome lid subunit RPN8/RPN11